MKKLIAALMLAFLLFGATSVSWGKAKGESATWEQKGAGKVWQ